VAKNSGVDRRAFLGGIATAGAGAAAAAAGVAPKPAAAETIATAAAPAAPGKLAPPNALLAQAENGNPNAAKSSIDRWHVHNAGSDYMVDALKHVGYDYLTCMPGSTFRGIHESIINYGGNTKPEMLSCVHEEISAAMAHGYAKMAGKPMAILVHNTVGLQHASMAIYNAYADRVPMLILVGNIADSETRRPGVEYYHTATDVAAIVRGFIKYDAQPMSLQSFGEEIQKAHAMAMTAPMEPTLVIVDADLAEAPVDKTPAPLPKYTPVRQSVADPAALADVAKLLVNAKNPLIVADRCARTQAGMDGLITLAESLQIPVIDQGNRMNFPYNHHLYASFDRQLIGQADVLLALEVGDIFGVVAAMSDLPERETRMRIKPDCTVISINSLYNQGAGNYQDQQRPWQPAMAIAGEAEASLPYLNAAVASALTADRKAQNAARAAHFADAFTARRQTNLAQAAVGWDATPISVARMVMETYALIKNDDFSLVSATGFQSNWPQRLWDLTKHHQYNGDSGAYGVGYGMPAAVGAALAARDQGRYSVNFQGDGDFLVSPGSLWTAAHHKIPLLTIMHNNRAWHQETMHVQRVADRRERQPEHARTGTLIGDPNIDFAKMAQSFGVYADDKPVTDPTQLSAALARALKVVKSGMPALVDVISQPR
jgi:thiamine pyrophosphate-dependent acetolactate synthase large subunit-like protein